MLPGITTEFSGTNPLYSIGSGLLTSIILVLFVITVFAPSTAPFDTITHSTIIHLEPIKQSSSIITGLAPTGSKTPPIPTPPLR